MLWDIDELSVVPTTHPASDFEAAGVGALFYEGLPWRGRPTRVFAWYGRPEGTGDEAVPAMVLVHGGGGTAFADWVRLWVARGYAAIAMDTCGCTAGGEHGNRPRHDVGGPPGWGGFDQLDEPVEDQWMHHAVADVVLAHSLLRSMPGVDAERVGLTGISWGGIVACTASGIDPRFRLATPVYGCGFLGDFWRERWAELGPERTEMWLRHWDPSNYLPAAECPMLWMVGTNDLAFPIAQVQKSYRLPQGSRTVSIRVGMPHSQEEGAAPAEIGVFADSILRGGTPLAHITDQGASGATTWATFESAVPVAAAEVCWTCDGGPWKEREWHVAPATLDAAAGRAEAAVPEGAMQHFLNLIDERGLFTSAEHVEAGGG